MQKIMVTLTVYFENPFWVGVYERLENGALSVCKITFGAEPKDYQVHALLLDNWHQLRFSPAVAAEETPPPRKNPKRIHREITRQLAGSGTSTKSQQALKLQQQEGKEARTKRSRQQRQEEEQRRYALRQQKKKERKKGH